MTEPPLNPIGDDSDSARHRPVPSVRCPEWCTDQGRPNHRSGSDLGFSGDGGLSSIHTGPRWGAFTAVGDIDLDTGELTVDINVDIVVVLEEINGTSDPAALRQFAADALAAADWMESHPNPVCGMSTAGIERPTETRSDLRT